LSGRLGVIASSLLIATFWLLAVAPLCSAQTDEPIGSEWVYSIRGEFSDMPELTGTWTLSCERIVTSPIGDTQEEAVEYHSIMDADQSGYILSNGYSRSIVSSEDIYYDLDTSGIIGYVSNTHVDVRYDYGYSVSTDSYDELDRTVFTPPGGTGAEPSEISVGESWTKTYTKVKNLSYYTDGTYNTDEHTFTETSEYTYLGSETVTVPAGVFTCNVFEIVSSDGYTEMSWYAPEISGYAKVEDDYGFSEVYTYELTSYHLETSSSGGTVAMGSDLFVGAFCAFVVVTVAAAVYVSTVLKREQKVDDSPPPPDWYS
jgi:hypothetical protein